MKYIFELNHPKHYYQFKYIMSLLQSRGHTIKVLARDKDVLLKVLKEEKVSYEIFGVHKDNIFGKLLSSLNIFRQYWKIAKYYSPDVIVSKASLYGTLVAKILRCQSFIFPDSEVVLLTNKVVAPLATHIITPEPFSINFGNKQKRIKGLFEDCYLAPDIFTIDEQYPEKKGLNRPYAIIRFVGWSANHDINNKGFSLNDKKELVMTLNKYLTVYISSERELPSELSPFKLTTPPSQIHNVLGNADLYVGDSQTMASEAALLGTPSIRYNSFVGDNDMSNFKMLEKKYGLLYNYSNFDQVLTKAIDIVISSSKAVWKEKRREYYLKVGNTNLFIANLLEK